MKTVKTSVQDFDGGVCPEFVFGPTPGKVIDNDKKTLRDEFAMAALTGLMSNNMVSNSMGKLMSISGKDAAEICSIMSYEYADEMMEARKVKS